MLPGAERVEDAMKFIAEAAAGGARGVIVISVDDDGNIDPRVFGLVKRGETAFCGAYLSADSVRGDE